MLLCVVITNVIQTTVPDKGLRDSLRQGGSLRLSLASALHTIQSVLSARRPLLGLPLTQNHRRLRHEWCDERRMWVAEWNEVVITDESRICLQHHDGRIRVWRHLGERMQN
ncbi:transposable element Tcb1 transposase [Trichonephila clavipes]|nr:transposable element Tcb1 transposase [Trichonephila clavipes]